MVKVLGTCSVTHLVHLLCLSHLIMCVIQVADYKLNLRCFDVFKRKCHIVFEKSLLFQNLPDGSSTPPRKRGRPNVSVSSDSPAPVKVKKSYKVSAEFTESDEE